MKQTNKNNVSQAGNTRETSSEALKIIRQEVKYETLLRQKETSTKSKTKKISAKKPENSKSIKEVTTEKDALGVLGTSMIVLMLLGITLKIIYSKTHVIVDKFPILEGLLLKYEYFISSNMIRITESKIVEKIIYFANYFFN